MEEGKKKQKRRRTRRGNDSGVVSSNEKSLILREISSGGVVYKLVNKDLLWLVVRSNPSKVYPLDIWRLPKGWIDDEESGVLPGPYSKGEKRASSEILQETATREVKEEGGINSKVISKIGTEKFFFNSKIRKSKVLKFVTFFLMEYISDTKVGFGFETAEIRWLPYEKARRQLTHSGEKKILDKAKELLDSGIQISLV